MIIEAYFLILLVGFVYYYIDNVRLTKQQMLHKWGGIVERQRL